MKEILLNCDILLCQEIILLEEDCYLLSHISEDFCVKYIPSKQSQSPDGDGRPVGGLAIFFRKKLRLTVSSLIESPNYCLYKIEQGRMTFHLVNVYMPCHQRNLSSDIEFQNLLGEFHTILESLEDDKIVFAGDFNANSANNSRPWNSLVDFAHENYLVFRDLGLPSDSFTYLSPSHHTTSWIDHVLTSNSVSVKNIKVLYSFSLFDHFPISFDVQLPLSRCVVESGETKLDKRFVDWKLFNNPGTKHLYNCKLKESFSRTEICLESNCNASHDHRTMIENFHRDIVTAFRTATEEFE